MSGCGLSISVASGQFDLLRAGLQLPAGGQVLELELGIRVGQENTWSNIPLVL